MHGSLLKKVATLHQTQTQMHSIQSLVVKGVKGNLANNIITTQGISQLKNAKREMGDVPQGSCRTAPQPEIQTFVLQVLDKVQSLDIFSSQGCYGGTGSCKLLLQVSAHSTYSILC